MCTGTVTHYQPLVLMLSGTVALQWPAYCTGQTGWLGFRNSSPIFVSLLALNVQATNR